MTPAYNAIPKFFAENDYNNPSDKAPFNTAFKTDLPVFKWREHNPENAKAGQDFMAAQRIGQRSVWDGLVPLHDFTLSTDDLAQGRVLMCDVGGGSGHQCVEFRKYHPEIQGSIVTEDLPNIHALIQDQQSLASQDILLLPHDFMDAQPIRGAKIYYLRNVIHNWNDDASRVILSQIAKVMAEDSVLIIDDVVLPEASVSWKQSNMDLAMMRSEEHFGRLLEEAGLRLRDVWQYDNDYGDSFVVAVFGSAKTTATTNGAVNDAANGAVNGAVNSYA
jgi:demethylsterigmatocystin 6-O-methyltransferase